MEENNMMEQPADLNSNVGEQITKSEEGSDGAGSILGKFKDTTSLLDAYNSLQKEFTRKSQKLAELTKLLEEKTQNSQKEDEKTAQNEQNGTNPPQSEEQRPLFFTSQWRSRVAKFFEENPEAKPHSKEISNILISDPKLASLNNCLDYAFSLVKAKNTKPVDIDNPSTLSLLAENEKIKNAVIEKYLQSLSASRSNLRFISGEPTTLAVTPTPKKPKTIKDASNILKKLLQS